MNIYVYIHIYSFLNTFLNYICVCFVFRFYLYVSVKYVLAHTKHQDPLFIVYLIFSTQLYMRDTDGTCPVERPRQRDVIDIVYCTKARTENKPSTAQRI